MAYNNNAYDFDLFMPKSNAAPEIKREEKKAVIKKLPVKRNKNNPYKALTFKLCIAIAIVLMVAFNIYTRVQISDTKIAISEAETQIDTLKSEGTRLEVELENLISYPNLEQAASALGMQKRTKSQIHYIDTSGDDYAEVIKK